MITHAVTPVKERSVNMTKQVKCRQCGKMIDKPAAIQLPNGYYMCSEQCRDEWMAAHAPKPKQPPNDDRKALLAYIRQLDHNANFIVITAQLKRMIADYGMTYAGMRYALWWSVNMANKPYKGIGILPYVYQDAKNYWQWQQRMKQQVAGWTPADDDAVIVRHDKEEDVFV